MSVDAQSEVGCNSELMSARHAPADQSAETLRYENQTLWLIDQTILPGRFELLACRTVEHSHDAIKRLVVRGAPAIGIAAAYGICLARDASGNVSRTTFLDAADYLATSRPTAVNLFWAVDRMKGVIDRVENESDLLAELEKEARAIHQEDRQMCRDIGRWGAELLVGKENLLTHCNAGGLATSTWGTALAPIYHLHEQGTSVQVFADETRPLLQGARLTAWELSRAGVPVTVITDSMAGSMMRLGKIDAIIVGADRIAANGDAANKIGTYPLAVLASYHELPFYVAAPSNTFDFELNSGDLIPIEERSREEVSAPYEQITVPSQANVANPAFDVTPAGLITAIITEKGIVRSPDSAGIADLLR